LFVFLGALVASTVYGADPSDRSLASVEGGRLFRAESFGTGTFRLRAENRFTAVYGPDSRSSITGNWKIDYDESGQLTGYRPKGSVPLFGQNVAAEERDIVGKGY
jgi:hypothetical protein